MAVFLSLEELTALGRPWPALKSISEPETRRYPMTRRMCLGFLLTAFPLHVLARPKLGDEEWMRCFRAFVKLFNNFVESLNDGKFDTAIWHRTRVAWTRLEVD
jgi:hypothetical protein